MRYGDTRGEGPRVERRQHAQRCLALRRPARARRSDGRRKAGCRVILCMICTRATPPSRPMVHRSLALPLFSSLVTLRDDVSATSLQCVWCMTFGGFLQGSLGSTHHSSPAMLGVDTVLAPEMRVGIKSEARRQLRHRFDLYDFNTSAGIPTRGQSHGNVPSTCRKRIKTLGSFHLMTQ